MSAFIRKLFNWTESRQILTDEVGCLFSYQTFPLETFDEWDVSSFRIFLLCTNLLHIGTEERRLGFAVSVLEKYSENKILITEVDADFKGYEIFLLEILTVLPLASLQIISFLKIYNILMFLFIKSKFNMTCS